MHGTKTQGLQNKPINDDSKTGMRFSEDTSGFIHSGAADKRKDGKQASRPNYFKRTGGLQQSVRVPRLPYHEASSAHHSPDVPDYTGSNIQISNVISNPSIQFSPYVNGKAKAFKHITLEVMKSCTFKPRSEFNFQVIYPERFKNTVYAYARRGVLVGKESSKPYLRLECPITSDEAQGATFKGQGLFKYITLTSEIAEEILEVLKPTCVGIWGPQVKKGTFKVAEVGVNACSIYDKDMVYTVFPHHKYTKCFEYVDEKKDIKEVNLATFISNSGHSFFQSRFSLNTFEVLYVAEENLVLLKGYVNVNALTLLNKGQDRIPPAELEERQAKLDKEIKEDLAAVAEIPFFPAEIKRADEGAKALLNSYAAGITYDEFTEERALVKLPEIELVDVPMITSTPKKKKEKKKRSLSPEPKKRGGVRKKSKTKKSKFVDDEAEEDGSEKD